MQGINAEPLTKKQQYEISYRNTRLWKIRNDGYVYLDKTDLIYDLVHNGNIYFLSRPRRFGKSLLILPWNATSKEKELFKGLAIEQLEKEWKQYPVFI